LSGFQLQKIPPIAIQILEDHDGSVGFLSRLLDKDDALRLHVLVIAPEVVGVEKEESAAGGLVPDALPLLRRRGFGQQQAAILNPYPVDSASFNRKCCCTGFE
jgi:hypothetical protein